MEDKFFMQDSKETYDTVIRSRAFQRYDIREISVQLQKIQNRFRFKRGRNPLNKDVFSLISKVLKGCYRKKLEKILFKKSNSWFINIGQYFFFNLYEWGQNFKLWKRRNFIINWLMTFLDFEEGAPEYKKHQDHILSIPEKILLELTNNCNLNCIMCGVGKYNYNPYRNLSLGLLKNLCKSVLSKVSLIRLNGLGESTVIPNFLDYISVLKQVKAQLEIVTNLTIQKKEIWDYLVNMGTNFLISCDSSNPRRYEYIRKGSNFKNFEANLNYIGKKISNPLKAQIIFTLMEINIEDLIGVLKLAIKYGLGGVIVNVIKSDKDQRKWTRRHYNRIIEIFRNSYKIAKDSGINIKLPDHIGDKKVDKDISNPTCLVHCENPYKEVYIRYNGDLTVCNMLNPYIYGNCTNYSFEKIWKGLNAFMFRSFVNSKYSHYYCDNCYYLI